MKKITQSTIITLVITLAIGLGLGWFIFGGGQRRESHEHDHRSEDEKGTIWTCAMHPKVRQDKPGKCPICGMDLTPLSQTAFTADDASTFQMTAAAAALINVQTTKITAGGNRVGELVLTGKIEADERRIYEVPAHFHGRLEKLYVNFTGEYVSKGEVLASVYSPDLVTAQQELIETLPYKVSNPAMYKAVRNKLKNWKIGDAEIDEIEQSGKVTNTLLIRSHHAGVVRKRHVAVGDHVDMGDILFEVVDLSHLWVMFDAYEQHLSRIKTDDQVEFTVTSLPGRLFKARITFIDPFIDPQTRVAKVRAEITNPNGTLKPEMFVRGIVSIETGSSHGKKLLVPESAVLWTGKRSLVYVKKQGPEQPTFEYRQVVLGPLTGDRFVVEKGLKAGEEVVTNGTFSIDAAAQLNGKASMMNPKREDSISDMQSNGSLMITSYMEIKEALVADDFENASESAKGMLQLPDLNAAIASSLQGIAGSSDLKEQRKHFGKLSQEVYLLIKKDGVSGTLYWNHCPMATEGKGANWLSISKQINNPYMGQRMPGCGSVQETLRNN